MWIGMIKFSLKITLPLLFIFIAKEEVLTKCEDLISSQPPPTVYATCTYEMKEKRMKQKRTKLYRWKSYPNTDQLPKLNVTMCEMESGNNAFNAESTDDHGNHDNHDDMDDMEDYITIIPLCSQVVKIYKCFLKPSDLKFDLKFCYDNHAFIPRKGKPPPTTISISTLSTLWLTTSTISTSTLSTLRSYVTPPNPTSTSTQDTGILFTTSTISTSTLSTLRSSVTPPNPTSTSTQDTGSLFTTSSSKPMTGEAEGVSQNKGGAIAGVVAASVLVIITILVVVFCCVIRRRRLERSKQTSENAFEHPAYNNANSTTRAVHGIGNPLYTRESVKSNRSHTYEEIPYAELANGSSVNPGVSGYEEIVNPNPTLPPRDVGVALNKRQLSVRSGAYEEIGDDSVRVEATPPLNRVDEGVANHNSVNDKDYVITDDYAVTFTDNELYNT